MYNSKKIEISLEEIIYYVMFSILLFTKGIGLDEGSLLFRACLLGSVGLFGAKIYIGRYTIAEFLLIGLGLIWGIFIFFHIGSLGIFVYVLMLFGMKNITVSKVIKVGTFVWGSCMLFTITAAIFFDRSGVRLVHEKLGMGALLRESLGYTHPNVLHISYILLMAMVLFLCKKENIVKTLILLAIGNIFIFIYSMSYTGLLISAVLVVAYIFFIYRRNITKLESFLIQAVLPGCIIVSNVLVPLIDEYSLLYRIINTLLNSRIWAIKFFFDEFSLTLFGEKIMFNNYSLDNSFTYALAWYGVVFVVIIFIGYFGVVRKYLKNERRRELAILVSFFIAGLTEQFLFNASVKNISVIFLGEVFYEYTKNKGKEIALGDKHNKIISFSPNVICRLREQIKSLINKKTVIIYIIINILIFVFLQFVTLVDYDYIYANERICDISGEVINIEHINDVEKIYIIGNRVENQGFYCFTRDNSNLIEFMEFRYKLSLDIYVSTIIIGIYCIWRLCRKENVQWK